MDKPVRDCGGCARVLTAFQLWKHSLSNKIDGHGFSFNFPDKRTMKLDNIPLFRTSLPT
jgi:hypothetical protein